MILGLDFGRQLGVAAISKDGQELLHTETWSYQQEHHSVVCYAYFTRIYRRLDSSVLLAYEDLHSMGGTLKSSAWRSLWYGFRTVTWLACEQSHTRFVPVTIHEWHKEAGLGGRPSTRELMTAAEIRVRRMKTTGGPDNDNEAAAMFVALAALKAEEVSDERAS